MSTYTDASLVFYPSGYKAGRADSLKPTDGTGNLTFTRASTATRVNEDGLIESVATGVPRIDFTGGGCGKLLLEPQRTNSVLNSNDTFSNGTNGTSATTTTPSIIVGVNYRQMTASAIDGNIFCPVTALSAAPTGLMCFSVFLKKGTCSDVQLIDQNTTGKFIRVNLNNGTIISQSAGVVCGVESYGNDVYRVYIVQDFTAIGFRYDLLAKTIGTFYFTTAQFESGSYPTSAILTTTTAVTRVADAASKTGITSLINSPEGSFYVEAKALFNGGTFRSFSLTDGTEPNRITFNWSSNASVFLLFVKLGGSVIVNNSTSAFSQTDNNKVLLKWGGGTYKLFINGVLKTTLTGLAMPSASLFDRLTFDASFTPFEGRVQGVMIFPTQVSDTDAISLTTL
jgi:hypothetical protein